MAPTRSHEATLLEPVERELERAARELGTVHNARVEILEGVSARVSGFSLRAFRERFAGNYEFDVARVEARAERVAALLALSRVPAALALSALAREEISDSDAKSSGAYYTDFRLAMFLARTAARDLPPGALVLDPACGTGALLAAIVMESCGSDRAKASAMIGERIYAADLSPNALRGLRLVLAALTPDLDSVAAAGGHTRSWDSLVATPLDWATLAPGGFGLTIGNPPWERLKVTRHEALKARGTARHYGAEYGTVSDLPLFQEKSRMAQYVSTVVTDMAFQGSGETDLYKAFTELAIRVASRDGRIALLVPAGLIRSQGTAALREALFDRSTALEITVFENRARFFCIDTRFKFVAVRAELGQGSSSPVQLQHGVGTDDGAIVRSSTQLGRRTLREVRPDLSIPEVRTLDEWTIFRRASERGTLLGDAAGQWRPKIVREVDMTNDRKHFARTKEPESLAVVEGRMVHQYRFGAKRYVGGTGRSACWTSLPLGTSEIAPQFWIKPGALRSEVLRRTRVPRIGFCDITGQTNERSMLASVVPAGVVCGNKVPTVTFDGDDVDQRTLLWLAVANSLPFDWLLRRVVTTTVNFFVLLGLPMPKLAPGGLPARRIAALAEELVTLDEQREPHVDLWRVAERRAEIDIRVLDAYGLAADALETMLDDFPLLDRGQPAICGEGNSTVTRDLLLCRGLEFFSPHDPRTRLLRERLDEARTAGAVPFVPSELALRSGAGEDVDERKELHG